MDYKEYNTTIDNLKEMLDKYGVAVIPNVLCEREINDMRKGMWNMLETLTGKFENPIKQNNKTSWNSFYSLLPLHSMLIQHYKVGHAQFVWDLRQNPKIVSIFAKIWNCEMDELLTSFDGLSIHFPPEVTKRGWYRGANWLHTDQSFTRNDLECIQSFVTGYDINEGDATLRILEGSHLYHGEFASTYNKTDKSDWYKLRDDEYEFYTNKGCKSYCVKCPAGSMVFWDSRTIHSGIEAQQDRKKQNIRLVVYICQTPRSLAYNSDLIKKCIAFNDMRMTSHWPHKIKLFSKTPRTYGNILPPVSDLPKPNLTNLGLKLAGFN